MNIFRFYCLCTFIVLCNWGGIASAQIVEIPDKNLERAIRETLQLPDGVPITQQEMLRLTGLAAEVAEVETLIGLEYATNLKSLYLRNNPIKDLTPLAKLTQLELLHMPGVPINDLTPLGNLTQLKELTLSFCGIRDISPLASLTQLILLNLSGNDIVDVSPLANLTALKTLYLDGNQIVDLSPVQELFLTDFRYDEVKVRYDEVCVLPAAPIQDRIDTRNLPSIVLAWDDGILNRGGTWWDDSIPYDERIAYHDIWWHYIPFGLGFQLTPQGYQLVGDLSQAITRREELLSKNPNMLFLIDVRYAYASVDRYPEDWFGWLRDESGNLITVGNSAYLIDFRLPEVQDIIVQRVIAIAKCGLYDGIFFDSWNEDLVMLTANRGDSYLQYEGTPQYYSDLEKEQQARISILRRIREGVRDDFLILCNFNWNRLPLSAPYINGGFMETFPSADEHGYTRDDIIYIEDVLLWYEANVQEPKINCLRALGIGHEPPDSPRNKQWMRLFTTMSLTLSDGYVLYTLGTIGGQKQYQKHIWHPFWEADLGQPVGPTAQNYQNIEGLYIREFDNGWAVYNRSGNTQEISLAENVTGVASGQANIIHQLSDLDGEIYLKAKNLADVNRDGRVNILDLVQVANGFGKNSPDVNGDGVVNILDLVFVSGYFSAEE